MSDLNWLTWNKLSLSCAAMPAATPVICAMHVSGCPLYGGHTPYRHPCSSLCPIALYHMVACQEHSLSFKFNYGFSLMFNYYSLRVPQILTIDLRDQQSKLSLTVDWPFYLGFCQNYEFTHLAKRPKCL